MLTAVLAAACAILAAGSLLTAPAQAGGSQSAPLKVNKTTTASVIPLWVGRRSGGNGPTDYSASRSRALRR